LDIKKIQKSKFKNLCLAGRQENLKNKRILITAGPTWVAIDKVRVISNIASGQTGILLAKEAEKQGSKVTLILGPVGQVGLSSKINLKKFYYFNELHSLIKKELKNNKYDIVIHSAAVSDYQPKKIFSKKLKSDIKNFRVELESTVKIADKIKRYGPGVFLVVFKLELGIPENKMIDRASETMRDSGADLAVVNTFSLKCPYRALIIDEDKVFDRAYSKEELTRKLLKTISFKVN
jgi:phosphopantothenoylcysteine decarboxylase/phosphopantothenate--cysteine ligase